MRHNYHPACHQPCDNYPFDHTHGCQPQCTMACDHHVPPKHPIPEMPTGTVKENKFRIINGIPHLVDSPLLKWGPHIKIAEQIDTKITQRPDQGCIRLDAVFDCTNSLTPNMSLNNYLRTIIERKYDELEGILPVIGEWVSFKLTYHVTNAANDTIYANNSVVSCKESWLHITDMKDQFIQSCKSIMIVEIPDFTQYGAGMYTLNLDTLEVILNGFDPKEHMEDPALNPFYVFTDDYKKIVIDHERSAAIDPDYPAIVLSSINLNKSFGYNASVTTRLKLAFTAYMDDLIITPNTFGIWSSLTQPTDSILNLMKTDIDTMKAEIIVLQGVAEAQTVKLTNIETVLEQQGMAITTITTALQSMTETLTELSARVAALENGTPVVPTPPSSGTEEDDTPTDQEPEETDTPDPVVPDPDDSQTDTPDPPSEENPDETTPGSGGDEEGVEAP